LLRRRYRFHAEHGAGGFSNRQEFVCSNTADAIAVLTKKRTKPVRSASQDRPVIFLFPGQGKAYLDLGADLYRDEARFREELTAAAAGWCRSLELTFVISCSE